MPRTKFAALALVAGLAVTLAACDSAPKPPPSAHCPTPAPDLPGAFDPLVRKAVFSGLPAELTHYRTMSARDHYKLIYHMIPKDPSVAAGPEVDLQVYAAGAAPWQQPGAPSRAPADTEPINGKRAQVWSSADDKGAQLRWEYQSNTWAELRLERFDSDALRLVRRYAEKVRFDTGERVRLPWRLPALPNSVKVIALQVVDDYRGDNPWWVELALHDDCASLMNLHAYKGPIPGDSLDRNTTVKGHPAQLIRDSEGFGETVTIYPPDGISHLILVSFQILTKLGLASVTAFAEKVDLLGEPPTWTDRLFG